MVPQVSDPIYAELPELQRDEDLMNERFMDAIAGNITPEYLAQFRKAGVKLGHA